VLGSIASVGKVRGPSTSIPVGGCCQHSAIKCFDQEISSRVLSPKEPHGKIFLTYDIRWHWARPAEQKQSSFDVCPGIVKNKYKYKKKNRLKVKGNVKFLGK
jgi:hypothetical protein